MSLGAACGLALDALEDPVDGGSGDSEQVGEVGNAVGAVAVQIDQVAKRRLRATP